MTKDNLFLMDKALHQAKLALKNNEVPVGAIIIDQNNTIIARAYNKVETTKMPTAHAELLAIQKASKKRGDWRLNGCLIYVTLEPCLMCIGLIQISRIDGIIFGAHSNLFSSGLTNNTKHPLRARYLTIESGVRAAESIMLLQDFFKHMRKLRKEKREPAS